jgi:putative flavoprotein involved in K+ transport
MERAEHLGTVIIGGGQSGLAVGHELKQRGIDFVILDAQARTGDSWRMRWDSLRLFTPARLNGLPGLPFSGRGARFISKDEMAEYLESFAKHHALPICHGEQVERLAGLGRHFVVSTNRRVIQADHVVVAMANYQQPKIPEFASRLSKEIRQLHSSAYKNPEQLADGDVLVVGVGNSGADIALELSASRKTYLAGRETAHIPFRIESWFGRTFGIRMVRFVGHHVLTGNTPFGRKVRPKFLKNAAPLVRVKPQDLANAGVERVSRVAAVADGLPRLADGSSLPVGNVVWCTGYRSGFDWIDLPIFDEGSDLPRHERGVVNDQPGLYFVGLNFLHAATSDTVTGVARDARHVARILHHRQRAEVPARHLDPHPGVVRELRD